jgi:hypothetical protein
VNTVQYAWLRYETTFAPPDALRRLRDDTLRVMTRHGGAVWGVWTALFGMASNELVVVTAWPDSASPVATLQDALPDGFRVVASHHFSPTVRPTSADPVTRAGVYVHRFFRTREQHMQEIVDLSVEAWKTFATDEDYGTEQIAFFRPHARASDQERLGDMLLISWYPDLANWERSRNFPPAAGALFRKRAERVESSLPFAMRLLS